MAKPRPCCRLEGEADFASVCSRRWWIIPNLTLGKSTEVTVTLPDALENTA